MRAVPPPQGLYDGQHEHDACGVAFVATLTGEASHDIVAKALTALRNLEHRGASGAEPDSGDGAGILMQVPHEFFRAVCDFELPSYSGYAVGTAFIPGNAEAVAKTKAAHRRPRRRGGAQGPRLARRARPTPELLGETARACMPTLRPAVRRRRDRPGARDGAGADGVLPAQARRARDRRLLPVAVVAHPRLQGHADDRPARQVLPRPGRPTDRVGDGRRALALLDQHVPVVAAGAPVPLHRAQRRDQHRQGQPQLDAGPGGDAVQRPHPRRPRAGSTRSARPTRRTRRRSTRCSSCCTSAAGRCRTRS